MTRIIVSEAAREEIFSASDRYQARKPGLGDEFIDEINHALGLLAERPWLGAGIRYQARRFVIDRFPYSIIYRLADEDVVVVAVSHHRQKPYYWRKRL